MLADSSPNPITLANERTTITEACGIVGMSLPEWGITSAKMWCPFGDIYHHDGGMSKAFRVYPHDNTAYCFACSLFFTPVKLVAMSKGLSEADAAELLLELSNYVPPDIDSRWRAATESVEPLKTEYLAEALKVFCTRIDVDWEDKQFEDTIATRFRMCLGLLPRVHTEEEAAEWLSGTKKAMQHVLGELP